MTFMIKMVVFDEPAHIKQTTCFVDVCNVTSTSCYKYCCGNKQECDSVPQFTCYAFLATITIDLYNYNKTISSNGYDWSGDYPAICKSNTTDCYYDDRNIHDTWSIKNIEEVAWQIGVMFMVATFITLILTVLLVWWFVVLKWRNGYQTIKSNSEKI